MQTRTWSVLFLLVLLIAAALRIGTLRHEAVEGDELFSRRVATLPPLEGVTAVKEDLVHPPLYYLLLRAWIMVWGADATGIRSLSIAFGIASIALLGAFGRRSPTLRTPALLAASMVAVNDTHIFYSQQARSYSLYTFLIALLLYWLLFLENNHTKRWFWILGTLLMTTVLYTHYVGALFIACTVAAIQLSDVPRRIKCAAALAAALSFVLFLPWVASVLGVYRTRGGLAENLGWQGPPTVYDLKATWAQFVGVPDFKAATSSSAAIGLGLLVVGLLKCSHTDNTKSRWYAVALGLTAVVPPIVLFALSVRPLQVPLFGIRHLLPCMLPFCLLCCCGLQHITNHFPAQRKYLSAFGTLLLMSFALLPTLRSSTNLPRRQPYDMIAKDLKELSAINRQAAAYTTWAYGIGEPVNFYSTRQRVEPLPSELEHLPDRLILLYRPAVESEEASFKEIIAHGYISQATKYYTTGLGSSFGTNVSLMERRHK